MTTYRIYFDAHASYPMVWAFDQGPGTPEVKVAQAVLHGMSQLRYDQNPVPVQAWIEIEADLEMVESTATFWGRLWIRGIK